MPNDSSTQRFPGATFVVLLFVAAFALLSVSVVEQRLDDTKLSLELLRQRRREVRASLDDTQPRKPTWSQYDCRQLAPEGLADDRQDT